MCLAIPGRVVEIIDGEGLERRARIDIGGQNREVSLGLVPEARIGDHLVSHSGFALRVVPAPLELDGLRREGSNFRTG